MRLECRERFPRHRFNRKPQVSDPGMHHGTCVKHVPWCMSGSLTHGGGENVPDIPGACATHNFTYLVRGPWTVALCVFYGIHCIIKMAQEAQYKWPVFWPPLAVHITLPPFGSFMARSHRSRAAKCLNGDLVFNGTDIAAKKRPLPGMHGDNENISQQFKDAEL